MSASNKPAARECRGRGCPWRRYSLPAHPRASPELAGYPLLSSLSRISPRLRVLLVASNRRPFVFVKQLVLLAAWACGGSGSDSTGVPSNAEVAAVIVSGAPTGPAMVGQSINFVATAT